MCSSRPFGHSHRGLKMQKYPLKHANNGAVKTASVGLMHGSGYDEPSSPPLPFDNWHRLDEVVLKVIEGMKNGAE